MALVYKEALVMLNKKALAMKNMEPLVMKNKELLDKEPPMMVDNVDPIHMRYHHLPNPYCWMVLVHFFFQDFDLVPNSLVVR